MFQRGRYHVSESAFLSFLSVPMRLRTNEFVCRCSKKGLRKKEMSCKYDSCYAGQIITGNLLCREFPEFMPPPPSRGNRVCVLGFSQFPASFCVVCLFFVVSFVSFRVSFVQFVSFVPFVSFVSCVSFVTFGSFGLSCAVGFEIRCVVIVGREHSLRFFHLM